MRIACIHVPQFALQCATRIDPSLRGAPIIVVGAGLDRSSGTTARVALHSPIVQACSRAAWALGVRVGMTATAARGMSAELIVVQADPLLERNTVRALADVLLAAAVGSIVDPGGRVGPAGAHLAMYCEAPTRTRGTSFGDRLVERIASLGLTARIGIADDRFTAWVAASHGAAGQRADESAVVSVPRGGSAAFLAPQPLSLLAITPEVQHMLEALGVHTLGEFAALPAPSAGTRSSALTADYHALARGEGSTLLHPYAPDAPIREDVVVAGATRTADASDATHNPDAARTPSVPAAIALLAERLALRLEGRGRGAARLEVRAGTAKGEHVLAIDRISDAGGVLETPAQLADAISDALVAPLHDDLATIVRLAVVVTGEALAGDAVVAEPASARAAVSSASAAASASASADARDSLRAVPRPSPETVIGQDALSLVLANTGTRDAALGLALPALQPERRYRRTQRGKRRQHTRRAAEADVAQPRLFKL